MSYCKVFALPDLAPPSLWYTFTEKEAESSPFQYLHPAHSRQFPQIDKEKRKKSEETTYTPTSHHILSVGRVNRSREIIAHYARTFVADSTNAVLEFKTLFTFRGKSKSTAIGAEQESLGTSQLSRTGRDGTRSLHRSSYACGSLHNG
jgi:hypothetical protein